MKKIAVILTILSIGLSFSACFSQIDTVELDKFISAFCTSLEKSDLNGFTKMILPQAQLNGSALDNLDIEKIFSELKDNHREYNYRKIYENSIKEQVRFIKKGEFYLGGHHFGHLTAKLVKQAEEWVIASFDHCK